MSTNAIAFESLVCAPICGSGIGDDDTLRIGETALAITTVGNVLYVPELRLSVVNDKIVPKEAIHDAWTLGFEVRRAFQGRAGRYRAQFATTDSPESVCILTNFYSRNFYHWVTEELPKVVALERHGFTGRYVATQLPAFAMEFLELLGVSPDRLITNVEMPTVFRSAVFVTSMSGWAILQHADVYIAVREQLIERSSPGGPTAERIWLERGTSVNNPGRDLVNRDEVYAILGRFGIETVDMAAHPVSRQIQLACHATFLGGVHGAGFAHALFQPRASRVVECYSPLFINPGIYDICRLLRHRYAMLVYDNAYARYEHGQRVKVNCSLLELALQDLDSHSRRNDSNFGTGIL